MVEGSIQVKNDEQFPLLMVAGAGDAAAGAPPQTAASLWSNTNTVQHRRSWMERWPEYLSSCWMTFILLGISLLVFYAIGMLLIYKHEPIILLKCNDSKPASDVFYHNLIPRGGVFPLMAYSSYLANVALRYPSLHFKVLFLIDDSVASPLSKRTNFYTRLYPCVAFSDEYTIYNRREVKDFQRKYSNVNITVMFLSKYMGMTPLKYKWRTIPTLYLPFYARVFSVWMHGGVGLDLVKQNELYMAGQYNTDHKTSAILRQHNDGITAEGYIDTLNKIEREQETEFFSAFLNIVQKIFNETAAIFNNTLPFAFPGENSISVNEQPLVRTHRSKREISEGDPNIVSIDDKTSIQPDLVNIVLGNTSVVNVTGDINIKNLYEIASNDTVTDATIYIPKNDSILHNQTFHGDNFPDQMIQFKKQNAHPGVEMENNKTETPQMVFFYDVLIMSEPLRPNLEPQRLAMSERRENTRNESEPPKFVSVESGGTLVAATSPMHPFLAGILSAGCKRLHPKLAIENVLLTQCLGIHRNDNYCNGIHVF